MWAFAKTLVQGDPKEEAWVLVYHLNRMDIAPAAGTQAVTRFWHLLVLLTSSIHEKQAYPSQDHFHRVITSESEASSALA